MNKRDITKKITREKILKSAKELFIRKGIENTSTLEIAKNAKIAHGTIFIHFKNRDELILGMVYKEVRAITDKLYNLLKKTSDLKTLLNTYLDFIAKNEDFFFMIEKESPFLSQKAQKEIIMMECGTRGYFTEVIRDGIVKGEIKAVDMTTLISFLFGSISYYLRNKKTLAGGKSIIARKKDLIIETFLTLIRQRDPMDCQNLKKEKEVIRYG